MFFCFGEVKERKKKSKRKSKFKLMVMVKDLSVYKDNQNEQIV